MFSATVTTRVELRLRFPDGSPWSVAFSPGIERFIGAYPRVDGIDCGEPLLVFDRVERTI
jgi:hypothetical protein